MRPGLPTPASAAGAGAGGRARRRGSCRASRAGARPSTPPSRPTPASSSTGGARRATRHNDSSSRRPRPPPAPGRAERPRRRRPRDARAATRHPTDIKVQSHVYIVSFRILVSFPARLVVTSSERNVAWAYIDSLDARSPLPARADDPPHLVRVVFG